MWIRRHWQEIKEQKQTELKPDWPWGVQARLCEQMNGLKTVYSQDSKREKKPFWKKHRCRISIIKITKIKLLYKLLFFNRLFRYKKVPTGKNINSNFVFCSVGYKKAAETKIKLESNTSCPLSSGLVSTSGVSYALRRDVSMMIKFGSFIHREGFFSHSPKL